MLLDVSIATIYGASCKLHYIYTKIFGIVWPPIYFKVAGITVEKVSNHRFAPVLRVYLEFASSDLTKDVLETLQ